MRLIRLFAVLVLFSTAIVAAQDMAQTDRVQQDSSLRENTQRDNIRQEREFSATESSVKAALKELGAYTGGGRLPTLNGFVVEGLHLEQFDHPYYDFKIETVPLGDKTLVRVKANVSAWQGQVGTGQGMYRTLPSNGRLESDLLDRLKAYLANHLVTATTDTALIEQHIASLKQERASAESRLTEFKRQLELLERATGGEAQPQLVSPSRPNVAVLSEPSDHSPLLLRAQPDDEFEVMEQRGAWYRVKFDAAKSGWLHQSQVRETSAKAPVGRNSTDAAVQRAFTITREAMFPFAGDWPRLRDKNALFLFVQPSRLAPANSTADLKLKFAESVFADRFNQMTHSSSSKPFDGIVVIFLDKHGGVAAATVSDIKMWRQGTLSRAAFLAKCSLDPRSAFLQKPGKLSSQIPVRMPSSRNRERRSIKAMGVAQPVAKPVWLQQEDKTAVVHLRNAGEVRRRPLLLVEERKFFSPAPVGFFLYTVLIWPRKKSLKSERLAWPLFVIATESSPSLTKSR